MEDPKRMRTKLRLDLKDVRRQIEDLEDLLKSDKSEENVEAHRKLIEYEKKLKDQYEKMTGLSLDQASNLEEKGIRVAQKNYKKSGLSGFLAFLGGFLISWGFYNSVLQSVVGYGPQDVVNYFLGNNEPTENLFIFMVNMTYGPSFNFIVFPMVGGALLILLSGLFDSSRAKTFAILEGLGFIIASGVLCYILYISDDWDSAPKNFTDLYLYFALSVFISGFLIFIGGIGHQSGFRRFLGAITGILMIYSGAQYFLLTTVDESLDPLVVTQWAWITVPVVIASGIYGFIGFLRTIK